MTPDAYNVTFEGGYYKEGSSDPWKGGTYTAVVEAESQIEAILETVTALGQYGQIVSSDGDTDWTVFDDECELLIRVKLVQADDA